MNDDQGHAAREAEDTSTALAKDRIVHNALDIPCRPSNTPRPGDPAYIMLAFVAGTLLQVGAGATAYVSTLALAPQGRVDEAVAA